MVQSGSWNTEWEIKLICQVLFNSYSLINTPHARSQCRQEKCGGNWNHTELWLKHLDIWPFKSQQTREQMPKTVTSSCHCLLWCVCMLAEEWKMTICGQSSIISCVIVALSAGVFFYLRIFLVSDLVSCLISPLPLSIGIETDPAVDGRRTNEQINHSPPWSPVTGQVENRCGRLIVHILSAMAVARRPCQPSVHPPGFPSLRLVAFIWRHDSL